MAVGFWSLLSLSILHSKCFLVKFFSQSLRILGSKRMGMSDDGPDDSEALFKFSCFVTYVQYI